jgi:hypothetical protein
MKPFKIGLQTGSYEDEFKIHQDGSYFIPDKILTFNTKFWLTNSPQDRDKIFEDASIVQFPLVLSANKTVLGGKLTDSRGNPGKKSNCLFLNEFSRFLNRMY